MVPGACDAIRSLQRSEIPFVLMTNGGGRPEAEKAKQIHERLKDKDIEPFSEHQIVLSHTPMKEWIAPKYAEKKILLLGFDRVSDVARSYGFKRFVRPRQLISREPSVFGFSPYGLNAPEDVENEDVENEDALNPDEPFDAIVQMTDCVDWLAESQIILDVLSGRVHGREREGTTSSPLKQCVPYFNSNNDWVFSSSFPHPRLAQGSFITAITALWKQHSGGGELVIEHCGKPTTRTYDYAEKQLLKISKDPHRPFDRIYGIGDNPPVDVRGANCANGGGRWRSVLVRTGVYDVRSGNLANDLPFVEYHDVLDAVQHLLSESDVVASTTNEVAHRGPRVVSAKIFTQKDCMLCDEMRRDVEQFLVDRDDEKYPNMRIEMVDITRPENRSWYERYRYDIPVLHVHDQYAAKHRVNTSLLRGILSRVADGHALEQHGEPDARNYKNVKC